MTSSILFVMRSHRSSGMSDAEVAVFRNRYLRLFACLPFSTYPMCPFGLRSPIPDTSPYPFLFLFFLEFFFFLIYFICVLCTNDSDFLYSFNGFLYFSFSFLSLSPLWCRLSTFSLIPSFSSAGVSPPYNSFRSPKTQSLTNPHSRNPYPYFTLF